MKIVSERALRRRAVGWSNRFSALRRLVVGLVVAFLSGVMTPAAALASPPLTTYDAAVHVFDTIRPVDRLDVSVVVVGRAFPVYGDPASARPHVRLSHFRVAANTGSATVSRVTANKIAGDAFRDQVAGRLESEMGFNSIGTEVSVKTPLGVRVIDILAERNGSLVNFETKLGASRYLPSQRAKDWWIANGGVDVLGNGTKTTFPTVVIRGPLP